MLASRSLQTRRASILRRRRRSFGHQATLPPRRPMAAMLGPFSCPRLRQAPSWSIAALRCRPLAAHSAVLPATPAAAPLPPARACCSPAALALSAAKTSRAWSRRPRVWLAPAAPPRSPRRVPARRAPWVSTVQSQAQRLRHALLAPSRQLLARFWPQRACPASPTRTARPARRATHRPTCGTQRRWRAK